MSKRPGRQPSSVRVLVTGGTAPFPTRLSPRLHPKAPPAAASKAHGRSAEWVRVRFGVVAAALGAVCPPLRRCVDLGGPARLALLTLLAMASAPWSLAQEAPSITVVSWGGSYARASVKAYHEAFVKETGIQINLDEFNGGLAQVRVQVETGNVTWDVVDLEGMDTLLGCDEGLLQEIDYADLAPAPDGTPAAEDYPDDVLDCGVALLDYATVYAYNENFFPGAKPSSMADFFDLEKFPGRRGMRRSPYSNLEFALVGDGVPAAQVYEVLSTPEGVDRAFRKLDEIKSSVVWWETGAQAPQMLADGEVVMSTAYNGRIFSAQVLEKQPLAIVWNGQVQGWSYLNILTGAPNADLAKQFITFATSAESAARVASYISYGLVRRSAMALVGKHAEVGVEMLPHLPNAPQNMGSVVREDPEWWADNMDDMNERFAAWLLR